MSAGVIVGIVLVIAGLAGGALAFLFVNGVGRYVILGVTAILLIVGIVLTASSSTPEGGGLTQQNIGDVGAVGQVRNGQWEAPPVSYTVFPSTEFVAPWDESLRDELVNRTRTILQAENPAGFLTCGEAEAAFSRARDAAKNQKISESPNLRGVIEILKTKVRMTCNAN